MQIGSSPLLRRTSEKALLELRSLFGVFPAWNITAGGSEGHSWSCSMRMEMLRVQPMPLSLLHSSTRFVSCQLCSASVPASTLSAHAELLSFGATGTWEVQQSPACHRMKNPSSAGAWLPPAPPSSSHIPFKERLWNMFGFHFASSLLKPFLSSLFSQFVILLVQPSE